MDDKNSLNIILKKSGKVLPINNIFLDDTFENIRTKIFIHDETSNGLPFSPKLCCYEISKLSSTTEIEIQEDEEFEDEDDIDVDKDEEYLIIDEMEEEVKEEVKDIVSLPKTNEKNDDNYQVILLNDVTPIYYAFNSMSFSKPHIYITHLYDYLLETISLKEDITKMQLYLNIKQKFLLLTEQDFENVYNLLNLPNIENREFTKLLYRSRDDEKKKIPTTEFTRYIKQVGGLDNYSSFYSNTDISQLVNLKDQVPLFKFQNIELKIVGENIIDLSERFINTDIIFNTFQLTNLVPFMAIMGSRSYNSSNPIVKIYKNIDVPEKDLRLWVINEKKRDSQVTFRKFRGITLYMYVEEYDRYLYVNILENGVLIIKMELENEEEIQKVIDIIKNYLDDLITILNKNTKFFKVGRRLNYISESKLNIKSADVTIDTNIMIHKAALNEYIYLFPELFKVKETSNDMISMFYNKINYKNKNVTINIRDHLYEKDKSTISIFTAPHFMSLISIIQNISSIIDIYNKIAEVNNTPLEPEKQRLRAKQEIQQQKRLGAEVDSRRCQSIKRPDILSEIPLDKPKTYFLKFKNKVYSCENRINVGDKKRSFPYPGFANPMIPCCYVKDARKSLDVSKYVISSDSNDIPYQPSNIEIEYKYDNDVYKTFILRRISIDDNIHYFFIDETNKLIMIEDEELISQFNYKDDIWFPPIALSFLLGQEEFLYKYEEKAKKTTVYKNANIKPDFNRRTSDNINSPCEMKSKNKYFGYDKDSIPKCFKVPQLPEPILELSSYVKENVKNPHLLSSNELGYLYNIMHVLFNEHIKNPKGIYLRHGVQQNKSSILTIFFMVCKKFYNFASKQQFQEYIFNYLTDDLFKTLNGGFIANTYDSVSNFKETIKNPNNSIKWSDVVDLMYRVFKINTLVFDIPFIDKTNNIDDENIKISCNWYINNDLQKSFDENENFIILLKRRDAYEIVCLNVNDEKIEFVFNKSDPILKFCIEYYNQTCKINDEFPDEYKKNYSTSRITAEYLINKLKGTKFDIKYLVINPFNKITFLQLSNNALLVVKETGILEDFPTKESSTIYVNELPTLNEYIDIIKGINEYLDDDYKYSILGLTKNEKDKIDSVLTNLNYLVPIKESDVIENDYPILDIRYNNNVDNVLTSDKLDAKRIDYKNENMKLNNDILTIKTHLGKVFAITDLSNDNIILVEDLKRKVKDFSPRIEKFNSIYSCLYKIILELQKREKESYDSGIITLEQMTLQMEPQRLNFILHHITNEIVNDTNEQLLLNNVIISQIDKNNIVIPRHSEVIIDNIYEFLDWLKNKYSNDIQYE